MEKQAISLEIDSRTHFHSIDGLRGVAIIMVMLVHFTVATPYGTFLNRFMAFGSCGVDLFFVISGFLITGILIDSKYKKFYFRNFYIKRFLRIFPLYYGFIVVFLFIMPYVKTILSIPFIDAASLVYIKEKQIWFWTYLSNIEFAYGDKLHYFFHTWSLSIEEQYYMFWPIVIIIFSNKNILRICYLLISIALLFRIKSHFDGRDNYFIYVHSISRIDSLVVGSLIATILRLKINYLTVAKYSKILFSFGVAWILVVSTYYNGYWWNRYIVQVYGISVIGIFFGALICLLVIYSEREIKDSSFFHYLNKCLSNRVLRLFGKYSYALYIFHEQVKYCILYMFNRINLTSFYYFKTPLSNQLLLLVLGFSISLLLAMFSWISFEKPILSFRKFLIKKQPY